MSTARLLHPDECQRKIPEAQLPWLTDFRSTPRSLPKSPQASPSAAQWHPFPATHPVPGLTLVFMVRGARNEGKRMLGVTAALELTSVTGFPTSARLAVYDRKGRLAVVASTPHGLSTAPPSIPPLGRTCWEYSRRGVLWWLLFESQEQQDTFSVLLQSWVQLASSSAGSLPHPERSPISSLTCFSPPDSPSTASCFVGPPELQSSVRAASDNSAGTPRSLTQQVVWRSQSWSSPDIGHPSPTRKRSPLHQLGDTRPRSFSGSFMHGAVAVAQPLMPPPATMLSPTASPQAPHSYMPHPQPDPNLVGMSSFSQLATVPFGTDHPQNAPIVAPQPPPVTASPQTSSSNPVTYKTALEELAASIESAGQLPSLHWMQGGTDHAVVSALLEEPLVPDLLDVRRSANSTTAEEGPLPHLLFDDPFSPRVWNAL